MRLFSRLAIACGMAAVVFLAAAPVRAQTGTTTILTSTTIATGTSYFMLRVGGTSSPGPTLTIDPGASITTTGGGNIAFGIGAPASGTSGFGAIVQNGGFVGIGTGTNAGGSGQLYLGFSTDGTTYSSGSTSYTLNGGTIQLGSGSNTANTGLLIIGRHAGNNTFTQNGGLVQAYRTASNATVLAIGSAGVGGNLYTLTGGTFEGIGSGTVATGAFTVGNVGSGTLTINGAGATMAIEQTNAVLASGTASATVNLQNGTLALNGELTRGVPNGSTAPGTVSFTLGGGTLRPYNANLVVGSSTAANTAAFDITLAANSLSTITGVGWKSGTAHTVTVRSNLVGSGSLQFTGGTVVLSGSNTYTGNTTVNSGTLLLGNQNALRGSTFAGGTGTLAFTSVSGDTFNNFYYLGGLSGSSSLSLLDTNGVSIRLNFGFNNADTTFSGNLTNGGVIEKFGTGTTTLSGNITTGVTAGSLSAREGGIRQTGGTITLNRDNGSAAFNVGFGSGTSGTYVLESGTVVTTSVTGGHMRVGAGGGTGILTINGSSARAYFSGSNNTIGGNDIASNSGTGTINLMAGELAVNSLTTGTVAGSTGAFNFSGGTLRPYSQNTSIGRSDGTGFTIALAGTSATLSGLDAATGTARTLTILTTLVDGTAGAGGLNVSGGTVVLPRTNSYTGNTTVSSGTLSIGNGSTTGSIPGNVANNGTLVFDRSNAITYSGTISGSGNVLKQGAGQLTLSASNSFTGNTTVNSGTLLLGNQNALRGSTFAGGAGTLAFSNTSSATYTFGGLSGSSALSLTSTNGSAANLAFGANNASTTYSGNVTGAVAGGNMGVIKIGTGTTTISGNWTLGVDGATSGDGSLSVTEGEIRQDGGTVTLRRNQFSGPFPVGTASGSTGRYTITSGTVLATNSATPGGSNFRIGMNGGTGILTIDGGSARAFFSGTNNNLGGNDYNATSGTGTINLMAGELAVNSLTTGTVAGSTGAFNFSGGTLRPFSQDTSIGRNDGTGFTIALAGTSATLSGLDAATGTARTLTILTTLVDGTAGAAGAIFSGGTVSLAAANTYSGPTTIAGANTRLALAANGSFANSPTITVGNAGSSGAVLDLTAKTGTFSFTSGQTVGGIGTIRMDTGDTARFAGTFAPGNSPGILTIDGGTALLSGTTQIEMFGAVRGTGYDAVELVNSATLNYDNGVLALDFGSWLADQQSYQLFGSGSSTLLGDFSSVTIAGTNYTGLTFTGSNGVWTSQGTSPANQTLTFTEATGTLVIVPEPGAIALAGIGIAAAAWAYCRRK